MGLILAFLLVFGLMVSVPAGIVLLLLLGSRGQSRWQEWGFSTAICFLISGLLFVIARSAFPPATGPGSPTAQDFYLAVVGFMAAGGSLGFGLTAVLGGLITVGAWVSRRLRSRNRPD